MTVSLKQLISFLVIIYLFLLKITKATTNNTTTTPAIIKVFGSKIKKRVLSYSIIKIHQPNYLAL